MKHKIPYFNLRQIGRQFTLALFACSIYSSNYAQSIPLDKLGVQADAAPLVDFARQERPWGKAVGEGNAIADANGWPMEDATKVFFDLRSPFSWNGDAAIELLDKYHQDMTGTYKLSFDGQADISIVEGAGITFSNKNYNAVTNRTTVDVNMTFQQDVQATSICYLKFTNTKRTATSATNTGISNVKFIRPGYDVNNTPLVIDGYYDAICPFAYLRTMGLTATNDFPALGAFFGDNPTVSWAERKQPDYPNQTDGQGMAWEHIIDIANRSNKGLWINIPINAEPNYMTGLAKLFKQRLEPGLKVYFEISNELWNFGFPQFQYNAAAAEKEVADNPNSNLKLAGETKEANGRDWQVRRTLRMTKEMADAFKAEFGADCIGKSIFPNFAWWTWFEKDQYDKGLTWAKNTLGDPKGYLYGMAISGYGEDNGTRSSTVDELLSLQRPAIDNKYTTDWVGHKAVATKFGLKLTVYEGSTNFVEAFNITNKLKAVADPRFKDIVKYLVKETWFDKLQGDEFTFFALAGVHSSYGTWGVAEPSFVKERWERAPKWQAILEMTGKDCPIRGVGPLAVFDSNNGDKDNIISAYPNPSTGIVNLAIRTYSSEKLSVRVMNVAGNELKSYNVNINTDNILDLSDLDNGMYFININDGGRNISEKVVISK